MMKNKTRKLFFLLLISAFLNGTSEINANNFHIGKQTTLLAHRGSEEQNYKNLIEYRKGIVREAFKYLGLPYKWGATGPSSFDCSGLVKKVYHEFGVELPRVSIEQGLSGVLVDKRMENLRMGDLLYFNVQRGGYPHHIGIYIGSGFFIHARSSQGVTVNSLNESPWNASLRSVSRIFFSDIRINIDSKKSDNYITNKDKKKKNITQIETELLNYAARKRTDTQKYFLPESWK